VESQSSQLISATTKIELQPDRPLRVILDGRKLGDGGIGVYISNLITGFIKNGQVDLTVLTTPERSKLLPSGVKTVLDKAKNYSIDELFLMPKRLNLENYDLFHSPHFILPYGLKIPSIVTVHDTIHLSYPDSRLKAFISKKLICSALQRASKVVTVSQASRAALTEILPDCISKIEVIPNALSEYFKKPSAASPGIKGPFMLAVFSNTKRHKGLADLLTAFEAVSEQIGELQLILVGAGLTNENPDLHDFADILSSPRVTILGEISESWLKALYKSAQFLLSASVAEGFGLPVLEAKSQGTPIVARPVPAVLELLDDSDIVCADNSVEELAQGILDGAEKFAKSSGNKQPRIDLNKYSTEATANQMFNLYQAVVKNNSLGEAK